MDVGWQALSLSPSWCKGKTILVRATDALRLCREGGYEELPRVRAWEQLDGLGRQDMGRVRDFVSRARLTGFPLSSFEDGAVLALLRGAIKNQDLVLLRQGAGQGPARPTAEQRQLIAKIDAQTRNKLSYLGRQYKLLADVDLSKTPQRDSYEVVGREDAIQVLDGLATQMGSNPDLPPLLTKAREKLTADWRPPLSPDGLILLRRIKSLEAAKPDTEAPITPSQMKQMLQPSGIIEIELTDDDGQPVGGEAFELLLPDGSKRSGQLDADGYTKVTSIPEGTCQVTFPGLDAGDWSYSGSTAST